jgi:Raf kinase inhibitor-like YbhB/YbcL family protein
MRRLATWFIALVVPLLSCTGRRATEAILPESPEKLSIVLKSSAFAEGAMIPKKYTCDGAGVSPPLSWSGVTTTGPLALIVDDPDAPGGTFTHWVLFNIQPSVTELPEGIPPGAEARLAADGIAGQQGKNDFGDRGYGGPCPPSGKHHYYFRIYALNEKVQLGPNVTREQLLRAMKGHVVSEGRLIGSYAR